MNSVYVTWIILFAQHCSSQSEYSKSASTIRTENTIRYDTYAQTHELEYTWVIRNITAYETLDRHKILSPKLHAPTTHLYEWDIGIIPFEFYNGTETVNLRIYLSGGSTVREATASANISIINHKKQVLHNKHHTPLKYEAGSCRSWPDFCSRNDFFKNHLLENDTLTLLINIKWVPSYFHRPRVISNITNKTYNLAEDMDSMLENINLAHIKFPENAKNNLDNTDIQIHEIRYIWAIHNYSVHETFDTDVILSPKLHAPTTDKYEWDIKITPNGQSAYINDVKPITLEVFLSGNSVITTALGKYDISIINNEEEVLLRRNSSLGKFKAGFPRGLNDFCQKDDRFRKHFLVNDVLTLLIRIKWISQSQPSDNTLDQRENSSLRPSAIEPTITKCCNLSENLETMLENPTFADVVFATNDTDIPAHKAILACRSRVFANIFQEKYAKHGKSKLIRINVAQTDAEMVHAMLRYIYTGKCENLHKLADKLFIAAAEYDMDGLRKISERSLCDTLSAENAPKMLEFARKHGADELKFKTIKFILISYLNS